MGDLTLPGDIPGLLRRGSPVWIRHVGGRWPAVVEKDPAEHDREGGHWMIQFGTHFVGSRSVFLDLSDPTGRAHAAWWLTNAAGVSFHLDSDGHRRWSLHGGEFPRRSEDWSWEGIGPESRRMRLSASSTPSYGWDAVDCPALDDLNPDDPRLLPDGSRWVDAEALRRVVLHVAGREGYDG